MQISTRNNILVLSYSKFVSKEFYIMLCMLNNVWLQLVGQMLNDQKLNLMCDVSYILQLIVLGIESFFLIVYDY